MRPCDRCGSPITFKRDGAGAWVPLDPDGSKHWNTCKAERARRGPQTIEGKTIVGEFYRELPCRCSVPPWEECPDCEHWQAWNEEQIARALHEILGETR